MNDLSELIVDMERYTKSLLYDIDKGNVEYDSEVVQYFTPVALMFTNFEWLELIAENTLVDEDATIVKNFIELCKSLKSVNESNLNEAVENKLRQMFGGQL